MTTASPQSFVAQLMAVAEGIRFTYGQATISGDEQCAFMLAVERDEQDRPRYSGVILGPGLPRHEAQGLTWRVTADDGRVLHSGQTGGRGLFTFLIDTELADSQAPPTCYLSIVPSDVEVSDVSARTSRPARTSVRSAELFHETSVAPLWQDRLSEISNSTTQPADLIGALGDEPAVLAENQHWGWSDDREDIVIRCPFGGRPPGEQEPVTFPYHAGLVVAHDSQSVRHQRLIVVYHNQKLGLFQGRLSATDLPPSGNVELSEVTNELLKTLSAEQLAELLRDPNINHRDLQALKQQIENLKSEGEGNHEQS